MMSRAQIAQVREMEAGKQVVWEKRNSNPETLVVENRFGKSNGEMVSSEEVEEAEG